MKKKLALLMAAIMTVAMVPMTAFAATKLTVATDVSTATGDEHPFTSIVELKNDNGVVGETEELQVTLKLDNGKFAKAEGLTIDGELFKDDEKYVMNDDSYLWEKKLNGYGNIDDKIKDITVKNDTTATITLRAGVFIESAKVVLPIRAYAVDTGEVKATLSSNKDIVFSVSGIIATAYDTEVSIAVDGVRTFVEDAKKTDSVKDITIEGLVNGAISNGSEIKLKLKGNYKFTEGKTIKADFLNDITIEVNKYDDDEIVIPVAGIDEDMLPFVTITGISLTTEKKCSAGDKATITVSSKDFDTVKLEVAKMVEEAVTYTVEDDDLPTIWAGKDYADRIKLDDITADDTNTLKVSVEENTGDILNTSRKATFTFPDGIEVVGVKFKNAPDVAANGQIETEDKDGYLEIDENVVTIWNYQKKANADESDSEKGKTDFDVEFVLNAAPSFNGDVTVTLGGEFDDVELKVATVKAPYTVEAKTTEVLIDYRYVPVNEIVITEAEEGLLEEDMEIALEVEKMNFEDAGTYEVTEGDIDVDVDIEDDDVARLVVTVKDESTEASTITISGLELYLDRTLPVGGYALQNVDADNILWQNSRDFKDTKKDADKEEALGYEENGLFKYKELVCNDNYVEVVTQARDQDDSTTNRKIVITIGATTMAVGTETITLDTPAYINAENYTELPLRAVSEAFGATVNWDDASRTVTIMMGQRIVSMTIGSKTMYINGTPVAMNTAPEITNERTFVPVRDLANALGISKIDWNEASATVTLN